MSSNMTCKVISKEFVSKDTFMLSIEFEEKPKPGQFVMIRPNEKSSDPFLNRPLSVYDWENSVLKLMIKVVGIGTQILSNYDQGDTVKVVGPLGNSFPDIDGKILFVGGGVGIAPLYYAAKLMNCTKKLFILGFQNRNSVVLDKEYSKIAELKIATDDGSVGFSGYPHEYLKELLEKESFDAVLTCGPMPLMEGVHNTIKDLGIKDYHSLESTMGCGLGACLGCRVDLKNGNSLMVCKDGPVFTGQEVF